jgi:hypothetical protein
LVRRHIRTAAGRPPPQWKSSFAARDAVVRANKVRAIVLRQNSSSAAPQPSWWTNAELWGTMSAVAGWYVVICIVKQQSIARSAILLGRCSQGLTSFF